VIAARKPIRHPGDGRVIAAGKASGGAGSRVARTFKRKAIGHARYVAVLYRDEAGNWGLLRDARVRRAVRRR
jgi:hypothetical protein